MDNNDSSLITVAIYSANFGKYRDETINGIDNIKMGKEIDYYFFTDDLEITSKYWNIHRLPLQPDSDFMDTFRHSSKHTKWIIPEILKKYDILIWLDAKCINDIQTSKTFDERQCAGYERWIQHGGKFDKKKIVDLFVSSKEKSVFLLHLFSFKTPTSWAELSEQKCTGCASLMRNGVKHPYRTSAQNELRVTMNIGCEVTENGTTFLNKIRNIEFQTCLPDTKCVLFQNNPENNALFRDVYDTLLLEGLRRDQNVINYVIHKNNMESKVGSYHLENIT